MSLGQFDESERAIRFRRQKGEDGLLLDVDPFLVAAWYLTGLQVESEMERMNARYRRNPFLSAVLRFAIGHMNESDFLAAAQGIPAGRGAAAFYIALKEQKAGRRDSVVRWLREAVDNGNPRYPERQAATTMLRRYGVNRATP